MDRPLRLRSFYVFFFILLMFFAACNKFEGEQTIPSYLKIDTVFFSTNYPTQGSKTHNFTDVWVYVNDQLIGAFEMPVTIPILITGSQKLEIRPGIKLNGISATRAPYPFIKPYINNSFTFFQDSIVSLKPTVSYYDNINFVWTEDFEGTGLSIEKTPQSDTNIAKTQPSNHPEALLSEYSSYSGYVHLENDKKKFQIASFNGYDLPGKGTPVFLEIDYKCSRYFGVGLFANVDNSVVSLPLVVVNQSNVWNKIYINLSPIVTEYNTARDFKVYFESEKGDDENARFYFDNIKLIYRNNL
jgi:hypothetical protein